MIAPLGLGALFVVLAFPVRVVLARCSWTTRTPRAAVVVWQAIALSLGLTLGLAALSFVNLATPMAGPRRTITDFTAASAAQATPGALTSNQIFALTAGGIVALLVIVTSAAHAISVRRTRERQRLLVDLVTIDHRDIPGAVVVEHDLPVAYAIPGRRARVVLSSTAVELLDEGEISAVVAHERAHLRARHDLALLPFAALVRMLPSSNACAETFDRVAELLEMAADDQVRRADESPSRASALIHLSAPVIRQRAQPDALREISRRIEQALEPARRAHLLVAGEIAGAASILVMPFVTVLAANGGR